MDKYQVVIRPLVTEQGTHQAQVYNAYPFQVHPKANKTEIKHAIEKIYNVRVVAYHHLAYYRNSTQLKNSF